MLKGTWAEVKEDLSWLEAAGFGPKQSNLRGTVEEKVKEAECFLNTVQTAWLGTNLEKAQAWMDSIFAG